MRIAVVSTYPPIECGIATYTQYLTDAVRDAGHEAYVISEYGGKGDHVFGAYSREGKDIAANVFLMASKLTPDIVHIQHEFGLYGEPKGIQVIELIIRCRVAGLPVITTFHTVRENLTPEERIVMRLIVQESSAMIVHESFHARILRDLFDAGDKVSVIPHGVREVVEVENARRQLDLEGKKVLLLCGYLRETKRFDRIVAMFPDIAAAVRESVLVIAGKSRSVDHPEYQRLLYRMVEESPVADRIAVLHGQFPQKTFDAILSAADVVALPYEIGGQSGIMAQCFAFRKPVVASNLRAFVNWIEESQGGLVGATDDEIKSHIVRLLKDDRLRESLRKNIGRFVSEKTSWRIVSAKHIEAYEKHVWRPTAMSRYFG